MNDDDSLPPPQPEFAEVPDAVDPSTSHQARSNSSEQLAARFADLYPELHRLAQSKMRAERDLTLIDTTVLVNESFLKLLARSTSPWQSGTPSWLTRRR